MRVLSEVTAGELGVTGTATAREIIRQRVRQEVERLNREGGPQFPELVAPEMDERILNGVRERQPVDWEAQFAKALKAFQGNGFLVLVDDRQVTGLDEEVQLADGSKVTFLKLVPLVGG